MIEDVLSLPQVRKGYVAHETGRQYANDGVDVWHMSGLLSYVGIKTVDDLVQQMLEARRIARELSRAVVIHHEGPYDLRVEPGFGAEILFSMFLSFGARRAMSSLEVTDLAAMLPLFQNGDWGPRSVEDLWSDLLDTAEVAVERSLACTVKGYIGRCECVVYPDGTVAVAPNTETKTVLLNVEAQAFRPRTGPLARAA